MMDKKHKGRSKGDRGTPITSATAVAESTSAPSLVPRAAPDAGTTLAVQSSNVGDGGILPKAVDAVISGTPAVRHSMGLPAASNGLASIHMDMILVSIFAKLDELSQSNVAVAKSVETKFAALESGQASNASILQTLQTPKEQPVQVIDVNNIAEMVTDKVMARILPLLQAQTAEVGAAATSSLAKVVDVVSTLHGNTHSSIENVVTNSRTQEERMEKFFADMQANMVAMDTRIMGSVKSLTDEIHAASTATSGLQTATDRISTTVDGISNTCAGIEQRVKAQQDELHVLPSVDTIIPLLQTQSDAIETVNAQIHDIQQRIATLCNQVSTHPDTSVTVTGAGQMQDNGELYARLGALEHELQSIASGIGSVPSTIHKARDEIIQGIEKLHAAAPNNGDMKQLVDGIGRLTELQDSVLESLTSLPAVITDAKVATTDAIERNIERLQQDSSALQGIVHATDKAVQRVAQALVPETGGGMGVPVHAQLQSLTTSFDTLSAHFSKLSANLDAVPTQMSGIGSRVEQSDTKLSKLSTLAEQQSATMESNIAEFRDLLTAKLSDLTSELQNALAESLKVGWDPRFQQVQTVLEQYSKGSTESTDQLLRAIQHISTSVDESRGQSATISSAVDTLVAQLADCSDAVTKTQSSLASTTDAVHVLKAETLTQLSAAARDGYGAVVADVRELLQKQQAIMREALQGLHETSTSGLNERLGHIDKELSTLQASIMDSIRTAPGSSVGNAGEITEAVSASTANIAHAIDSARDAITATLTQPMLQLDAHMTTQSKTLEVITDSICGIRSMHNEVRTAVDALQTTLAGIDSSVEQVRQTSSHLDDMSAQFHDRLTPVQRTLQELVCRPVTDEELKLQVLSVRDGILDIVARMPRMQDSILHKMAPTEGLVSQALKTLAQLQAQVGNINKMYKTNLEAANADLSNVKSSLEAMKVSWKQQSDEIKEVHRELAVVASMMSSFSSFVDVCTSGGLTSPILRTASNRRIKAPPPVQPLSRKPPSQSFDQHDDDNQASCESSRSFVEHLASDADSAATEKNNLFARIHTSGAASSKVEARRRKAEAKHIVRQQTPLAAKRLMDGTHMHDHASTSSSIASLHAGLDSVGSYPTDLDAEVLLPEAVDIDPASANKRSRTAPPRRPAGAPAIPAARAGSRVTLPATPIRSAHNHQHGNGEGRFQARALRTPDQLRAVHALDLSLASPGGTGRASSVKNRHISHAYSREVEVAEGATNLVGSGRRRSIDSSTPLRRGSTFSGPDPSRNLVDPLSSAAAEKPTGNPAPGTYIPKTVLQI